MGLEERGDLGGEGDAAMRITLDDGNRATSSSQRVATKAHTCGPQTGLAIAWAST